MTLRVVNALWCNHIILQIRLIKRVVVRHVLECLTLISYSRVDISIRRPISSTVSLHIVLSFWELVLSRFIINSADRRDAMIVDPVVVLIIIRSCCLSDLAVLFKR